MPEPGATLTGAVLDRRTGRVDAWCGRVSRKGVPWFIGELLPRLVETNPAVLYLVAGGGPEHDRSLEEARRRGLSDHLVMMVQVSEQVRHALLAGADVFAMPNISVSRDPEGFGIVALEAAEARLPVVATATDGIPDAVRDGQNGVLVPERDSAAFADAVTAFLTDSEGREAFGRRAREYTVREFAWEVSVRKHLAVFTRLLDSSHERRVG